MTGSRSALCGKDYDCLGAMYYVLSFILLLALYYVVCEVFGADFFSYQFVRVVVASV